MTHTNGSQGRNAIIGLKLLAVAGLLMLPGTPTSASVKKCSSFVPGCPVYDECEGTTAVWDPNCEIRCYETGEDPVDTAICHKEEIEG